MDHPDGMLDMLMVGEGEVAQRSVDTFLAWLPHVNGRAGRQVALQVPLLEEGVGPSFLAVTASQLPTPWRLIPDLVRQWFEAHPEQVPLTVAVHYPYACYGRVLVQSPETQRLMCLTVGLYDALTASHEERFVAALQEALKSDGPVGQGYFRHLKSIHLKRQWSLRQDTAASNGPRL